MIPKNRQELANTLKACLNPSTPAEMEEAYRSPYSPFLQKLLNAETNRAIHRFEVEEVLAFREFVAERERKREEEERIKDEIAREESQDRRMFERKDQVAQNMKAIVESKDLQDLKELKAAIPAHIEIFKTEIASLDQVIEAHVARREAISLAVQAINQASSQRFMDYLRANPDELVTSTGEPVHITEEILQETIQATTQTNSCVVCKVNPDFEERIISMPGKQGAIFCINRDSLVNELKCLAIAIELGIPITEFLRFNKGKQSIIGPQLTDEERENKLNHYNGFIVEGQSLQNAREKRARVETKLDRLEALKEVLEAIVEPELGVSSVKNPSN